MAAGYAKDQPKGFTNHIERVAIVGAGGHLGKYLTEALLKTGKHTITALTRAESTTAFPAGVKTARADYGDEDSIAAALKDQQFLIITLPGRTTPETHSKLVRGAAKAGVQYVMPNWYGGDLSNDDLGIDTALGPGGRANVAEIQSLGLRSIVLTCSFWYEWSMGIGPNAYGFDLEKRTLVLFDQGEVKINTTTWPQCGRAVAALLGLNVLPQDEGDNSTTLSQFFDGIVYISSFLVSQKDMFESVKRVTGTTDADWTVTSENSEERWREGREAMQKGELAGFARMLYTRVFFPNGGGDYETVKGTHNAVLGLPREDMDEYTKSMLRMVENKEFPHIG